LLLHFKVTLASEPVILVLSVTPENVSSCIRLEIPRRNQNDVTFSNPHSPFQFSSNSAQAFFAVLALRQASFTAQHFNNHTQNVISARQQHFLKACLVFDLSLTHLFNTNSLPRLLAASIF